MVMPHILIRRFEAITNVSKRNPAVRACVLAGQHALRTSNPEDDVETYWDICNAYSNAMPSLDGYENIRDYIACIAHGMLLGVFDSVDGPKHLYAAQIALCVLPREPRNPVGKPPKAEKLNTPHPPPKTHQN
jgi:hypothetical protein